MGADLLCLYDCNCLFLLSFFCLILFSFVLYYVVSFCVIFCHVLSINSLVCLLRTTEGPALGLLAVNP